MAIKISEINELTVKETDISYTLTDGYEDFPAFQSNPNPLQIGEK